MNDSIDGDPTPFDPLCERYAKDMPDYDWALGEGETREHYVIHYEGTYNYMNGHFLCDRCYIAAGQPSSANGWKCP